MGLRPEDMIKVTGENKFKGEDGIVKRLKGEKIKVRFFTYGSTYEEWLDPNEVRKMTQDEVLRGLTGPSEPITQNQMDGGDDDPTRDRRSNLRRPGGLRDGLMSNVSGFGGPRNRRFDREQRGEHGRRGFQDQVKGLQQEEKNWQWYQEQEQQRKNNGPRDDQFEMGIGSQRAKKDWSSDDDAQWGRQNSQRQQRRERRDNRRAGAPVADEEDWNSFVSKADDSEKSSSVDDDAFFDSLMSELEDEEETPAKNNVASKSKDEDDFFTSLMNELNDDEPARQPRRGEEQNRRMTKKDKAPAGPNKDEDDFFAALEAELSGTTTDSNAVQSEDGDDFFAKLESELEMELGGDDLQKEDSFDSLFGEESNTMSIETPERGEQSLENEMSEAFDELFSSSNNDDDNGDPLEYKSEQRRAPVKASPRAEEDMVSTGTAVATQPSSPAVATAGSTDGGSLQKKKVPELKEMLREKGLKVSGKKSELIERLLQG